MSCMSCSSELFLRSTLASPDYMYTCRWGLSIVFMFSGYPHPIVLQGAKGGWGDYHFTLFSTLLVGGILLYSAGLLPCPPPAFPQRSTPTPSLSLTLTVTLLPPPPPPLSTTQSHAHTHILWWALVISAARKKPNRKELGCFKWIAYK